MAINEDHIVEDEWKIIEDRWDPSKNEASESIFSIGNGHMGQRANFEEQYSGQHLQGSYIAGVYYPDKTRVGWWKNGYPEYFAKVLNSVNWIGIDVSVDGVSINLDQLKVVDFRRELNMKEGYLLRNFTLELSEGKRVAINSKRFLSMKRKEIGAICYSITLIGFEGTIQYRPYLDFDVVNADSNYDEKFWTPLQQNAGSQKAVISAKTKKLDFKVAAAIRYEIFEGDHHLTLYPSISNENACVGNSFEVKASEGVRYDLYKYASVVSSRDHDPDKLTTTADELASDAMRIGFSTLLEEQKQHWKKLWDNCDIAIEGDIRAQQGIRFNIYHLMQTYTGEDARLNIGPKGFTGEKYGGSTYWDTEAYCLPFYMASAEKEVAKNLLIYRYKHLQKAIENAEKLGFTNGAALYPMVTMNGEECHNEWEITFEEIHRNGAIAYAIFNYTRYFDDRSYLEKYGLEVLIAISRFWAQRFNWSADKSKYVMLGVTGPNEYENNVNNNWYTSYIARWTLHYTKECIDGLRSEKPERLDEIIRKTSLDQKPELKQWQHLIENVYLPSDNERGVFLQQDGFLDKELLKVDELPQEELPLNQHWSWDRILRSCFIKQADVLQGLYFFEDHFDRDVIAANYNFYEPMTVHESSLSPCVHVITAAYLDYMDQAYDLYLRTSRLDLDDYNKEVHEGLHITSMAGTWLSVVEGFGGMRIRDNKLCFDPKLPTKWDGISFCINFRGNRLKLEFGHSGYRIENVSGDEIEVVVKGHSVHVKTHIENDYQ